MSTKTKQPFDPAEKLAEFPSVPRPTTGNASADIMIEAAVFEAMKKLTPIITDRLIVALKGKIDIAP